MTNPDPPDRSPAWKYLLLVGITLVLVGGIVAILLIGEAPPTAPPPVAAPPIPTEDPLPKSPTELLRELTAATTNGNRPRQIRLLTDDWAAFILWADGEVNAVAEAKRKAVDAVRAAVGDDSARHVKELPDLPAVWPLFAGLDWAKAKLVDPDVIVAAGNTFAAEKSADGTWRLRPGPTADIEAMKADVVTAIAPLSATYSNVEEHAKAGRFTAATFPDALKTIRHLAVTAAHPPAKSR